LKDRDDWARLLKTTLRKHMEEQFMGNVSVSKAVFGGRRSGKTATGWQTKAQQMTAGQILKRQGTTFVGTSNPIYCSEDEPNVTRSAADLAADEVIASLKRGDY
jgi:hypothetical protein